MDFKRMTTSEIYIILNLREIIYAILSLSSIMVLISMYKKAGIPPSWYTVE